MNNSKVNLKVEETVKEIIFQANCEAESVNRSVTKKDIEIELESALDFISFENDRAKSMFSSFVMGRVRKELPSLYPRMALDQFGNYTTDSSKWV